MDKGEAFFLWAAAAAPKALIRELGRIKRKVAIKKTILTGCDVEQIQLAEQKRERKRLKQITVRCANGGTHQWKKKTYIYYDFPNARECGGCGKTERGNL